MRYRLKSIEAFQYMGGQYKNYGYVNLKFSDGSVTEKLIVPSQNGNAHVYVGDYIVTKPNGEAICFSKEMFETIYEPEE